MNPKTIEKIVVPLDGSDLAATAAPWAKLIATHAKSSIDLVGATDADDEADNLSTLATRLEESKIQLQSDSLHVSAFAHEGNPPAVIADHARDAKADLIVMASHGRTGVLGRLLGSVSFWLLRLTTTPVMIVKPESPGAAVKRILYPLNGRISSGIGLDIAAGLSRNMSAPLILMHVTESGYKAPENVTEAADALKTQAIDVELHVEQGDPKDRITQTVNDSEGTLVVLESATSTGIDLAKTGSFAEHLFANTSMPTIVVPKGR